MHVCDGCLCSRGIGKYDVCCAAVGVERAIHGHFYAANRAIVGEDFLEVGGEDVLCEFFYYNLWDTLVAAMFESGTSGILDDTFEDLGIGGVALLDLLRV